MRGGSKEDAKFIEEWTPFVKSIVHKIIASMDLSCDFDELMAFGFRGLIEARSRFDPSRGVQLNTFAYYRVRGAVLDGVREMAYLPRRVHVLRRAAEAADAALEDAGDARAAAPPGTKANKDDAANAIHDLLGKITATYILASLGQDDTAQPPSAEEAMIMAGEADRLRSAIDELPERERALVVGFYYEGRQFDHVASELGISKSWASRIHAKALKMLRDAIEGGD